eukprot:Platyproteum_vivax@DN6464_c0_g1_i1.p1
MSSSESDSPSEPPRYRHGNISECDQARIASAIARIETILFLRSQNLPIAHLDERIGVPGLCWESKSIRWIVRSGPSPSKCICVHVPDDHWNAFKDQPDETLKLKLKYALIALECHNDASRRQELESVAFIETEKEIVQKVMAEAINNNYKAESLAAAIRQPMSRLRWDGMKHRWIVNVQRLDTVNFHKTLAVPMATIERLGLDEAKHIRLVLEYRNSILQQYLDYLEKLLPTPAPAPFSPPKLTLPPFMPVFPPFVFNPLAFLPLMMPEPVFWPTMSASVLPVGVSFSPVNVTQVALYPTVQQALQVQPTLYHESPVQAVQLDQSVYMANEPSAIMEPDLLYSSEEATMPAIIPPQEPCVPQSALYTTQQRPIISTPLISPLSFYTTQHRAVSEPVSVPRVVECCYPDEPVEAEVEASGLEECSAKRLADSDSQESAAKRICVQQPVNSVQQTVTAPQPAVTVNPFVSLCMSPVPAAALVPPLRLVPPAPLAPELTLTVHEACQKLDIAEWADNYCAQLSLLCVTTTDRFRQVSGGNFRMLNLPDACIPLLRLL